MCDVFFLLPYCKNSKTKIHVLVQWIMKTKYALCTLPETVVQKKVLIGVILGDTDPTFSCHTFNEKNTPFLDMFYQIKVLGAILALNFLFPSIKQPFYNTERHSQLKNMF